jgi:hypothetical protein
MMPQCHGSVLVGVLLLAVAAACGRAEGSAVRIETLEPATPPAPSQADQSSAAAARTQLMGWARLALWLTQTNTASSGASTAM